MNILVDNSGYALTNLGDLAMLVAGVRRVKAIWPEARVRVLTGSPGRLRRYVPEAEALPIPKLVNWLRFRNTFRVFGDQIDALPRLARELLMKRGESKPTGEPEAPMELELFARRGWDGHIEAAKEADLVMATGGGYINDVFSTLAFSVLETLRVGVELGKPSVIVGHGFEKVKNTALANKMRRVLPTLDLIACREGVNGPDLLRGFGVPESKIVVTGDDAVELAYRERPNALGRGIGVNIRIVWYAGVSDTMVKALQGALTDLARQHNAPLIPIPISLADPSDVENNARLLASVDPATDGGKLLDSPQKAMHAAGQCRLVITGSYHAAVFALSQGVPVVALAQSTYYVNKFKGLMGQFPGGCTTVVLDDPDLHNALVRAVNETWERAETQRPLLLAQAEEQIALGYDTYRAIAALVKNRQRVAGSAPA